MVDTDSAPARTTATGGGPDSGGGRTALVVGLALIYTLWGSTYLGNRIALESLPPMVTTAGRFLLAAVVLLVIAGLRRSPQLVPTRAQFPGVAVTGILLIGVGSTLLAVGQQYVDSGLASLVVAAVPLWVLALRVCTGQRPSALVVAGVFGGVAGLALLLLAPGTQLHLAGTLTVLASSGVWAVGSWLSQRMAQPADPLVGIAWQMLIGGLAVAVASALTGELGGLRLAEVSGRSWIAWGYLLVVCTIVGYTVYSWLLRRAPLQLVATYAYVNPVVAVGLGMMVLDERLTGRQVLAGVFVLASVAVVVAVERPRQRGPSSPAAPATPT
ncbi:EamA family transporter [Micromonospora sp. NPDC005173]|uniref:EamA family transporter n=1 Tax=Micromonospora sp. NPDC005173 TaxID=3157165 RepID=UPI0033B9CFDD